MPAIACSAPGKIILFGEHAVVYSRPAIAVPFSGVKSKVAAFANPIAPTGQVVINAPGRKLKTTLDQLPPDDPIALAIHGVWEALGIQSMPAVELRITSSIPTAAGLGSSASVSVSLARAVSTFVGHPLPDETISQIAYHAEQSQHGNPSGIDNTVITYAQPVFFVRGQPIEFLIVPNPIFLIAADSGLPSSTARMVSDLRKRWQADQVRYETLFDQIGMITQTARTKIEEGEIAGLGPLLTTNHALLQELGVSCTELDRLVDAALRAGALGAKLSGAGGGGNMIALIAEGDEEKVTAALQEAGAVWTKSTIVSTRGEG